MFLRQGKRRGLLFVFFEVLAFSLGSSCHNLSFFVSEQTFDLFNTSQILMSVKDLIHALNYHKNPIFKTYT